MDESYEGMFKCRDGHIVKSKSEREIDNYLFEKGIEPPYVNRNWLMHGRSSRKIERFECIQLINALSTIEYVFSLSVRDNKQAKVAEIGDFAWK